MFGNPSDPFGELLKQLRKRQRLTQQKLADAMRVHRTTIGRWEEGSFLPESKAQVLELARCLQLSEPETRQLLDASLVAPTPVWSVPYPSNPFFTGRDDVLEWLHTHLGPGQQVALTQSYALHGLGGIGKTQLALEYAYRYALEYRAVFWLNTETLEQLHASLLRIAERLELPERTEPDQQRMVIAVQRWLETRSEWLLIWDNLEEPELLHRFLPSLRRGALLITTRQQALGTMAHGIDLTPMGEEEGLRFLLRRAKVLGPTITPEQARHFETTMPTEYAAAVDLVRVLGGLPLALDQAGAYIEATQCRLSEYLALFQHAPLRLLQERGTPVEHPASVVTTFALAFDQLQQRHRAAADLLTACCFLAPEAIPETLFTQHTMQLSPELQEALTDPLAFHNILKHLLAYALLQRHPDCQMLVVHRLVQAVLREQMSQSEQTVWKKRMISLLNAAFPDVTHEAWDECERLLPHVLACVDTQAEQDADQETLAEVLRKTADYLRERAQYEQAEALYQRALHLVEQAVGPEHLSVARLLHNLAFLSWAQGRSAQAEQLGERAVQIREQLLGPMHPDVALSLNSLANFCLEQGKYEHAEHLLWRVLRIREHTFGPSHPALAGSFNNLGILSAEQGKYEQALSMYQRALSISEQALGPDHPDLANPLNNLALLFTEQGKYAQAELMARRALVIWEKALGPEHPMVAEALKTLAQPSGAQGKHEQAEQMYRRALAIWEHALGPEHFQIAEALNGLANLSQKQGKDEQAEALYQRALRIREQQRGVHHPETAQTLYDLARFRQKQGNLSEAMALAERALTMRSSSLGDAHPRTIAARSLHAQLVQELAHT